MYKGDLSITFTKNNGSLSISFSSLKVILHARIEVGDNAEWLPMEAAMLVCEGANSGPANRTSIGRGQEQAATQHSPTPDASVGCLSKVALSHSHHPPSTSELEGLGRAK